MHGQQNIKKFKSITCQDTNSSMRQKNFTKYSINICNTVRIITIQELITFI